MSISYKRLSFTNKEEEHLIEFIKQHPALWDASHEEYGNGELRKHYWLAIARELSKSVLECRRKWRFIRDYYIHKRRKLSESTPQRDGKYFSLHFLDKVSVRRFAHPLKHQTNSKFRLQNRNDRSISKSIERVEKSEQDFDDSEVEYNYPSDVTFEKVTMERIDQSNNYLLDDEDHATNEEDQDTNDEQLADVMSNADYNFDESSIVHEFPVGHKFEENDEEHVMETHLEAQIEQTKQADVSMHERAIDLFFESMAAAVKTFPPQFVAEAKSKVFTAINELEMKVHSGVNGK